MIFDEIGYETLLRFRSECLDDEAGVGEGRLHHHRRRPTPAVDVVVPPPILLLPPRLPEESDDPLPKLPLDHPHRIADLPHLGHAVHVPLEVPQQQSRGVDEVCRGSVPRYGLPVRYHRRHSQLLRRVQEHVQPLQSRDGPL